MSAADLAPPAVAAAAAAAAASDAVSSAPGAAAAVPARSDRRQTEHIRALYTQTPASLTGNGVGMLLMAGIFWPLAPSAHIVGWLLVGAVLWGVRLWHYLRFLRHPEASADTLRAWRNSWKVLVLGQGAMWGVAAWLFWGLGSPFHMVSLIVIVVSYCLGSVQLLATQPRVFVAFLSLVLAPTILRIATDSTQAWHLQLAGILAILFGITAFMGRTYGTALSRAISLQARTDELADQLRIEKAEADAARQVADDARRAAEAASQAKTQFFAAASHDLRQPLHAMGLFAEALRQRIRDPEVASLVNSINESVDALEGLFGELLDITRIDTGGVEVNPAPTRLKELFGRLRLHFEPAAFEKGLMLSFHGEQRVAHVDPVLLERILRNLVSNAIRYSDDGGVLVSCRPRTVDGVAKLLVQVWDSGIGISPTNLPRIFDEFYQAQSNRPLLAHHRKGLGLGLAIVKRLAGLMGTTVEVHSRVGHGTVFSLLVPLGKASRSWDAANANGPAAKAALLGLTLQGRFIVVVEDEAAVREGLVVLLQAWGAQVVSFDTVDGVRHWLAAADARQPDLLLVDYRLPQGTTGIDALVALRAHWPGAKLPAIVITGSSLGGHEDEAVTHDYHLLIKPVLPNKLRAMIAFKLGVRA